MGRHTVSITKIIALFTIIILSPVLLHAQGAIEWTKEGNGYYRVEGGEIVLYTLPQNTKTVLVGKSQLTPAGKTAPITFRSFSVSDNEQRWLLFTNTKKVWRLQTRGDYWVLDTQTGSLQQIGKNRPASSLMFAKFSPDASKVAYVSDYNLYVEDLGTGQVTPLTSDGNRKFI